jgi:hypothetical protein
MKLWTMEPCADNQDLIIALAIEMEKAAGSR